MMTKIIMLGVLIALLQGAFAQTMITNCAELQNMNLDLAGNYALANDIDCSATASWNGGLGFEPVGSIAQQFSGSLNGHGHTILNLTINRPSTDQVGMFGITSGTATITSLNMQGAMITGNGDVGSLVGQNAGTLTYIGITGDVSGNANHVGGLVGYSAGGTIEDCTANSAVSSSGNLVGGLVGYNTGSITRCAAFHDINSPASHQAGGLVGWSTNGIIRNSYAIGDVSCAQTAGSFAGANYGPSALIENCYARGDAFSSTNYAGGLTGTTDNGASVVNSYGIGSVSTPGSSKGGLNGFLVGSISSSYWDTQTTGQGSSAGGIGKTTAEMYQEATFVGWDFTDTWWINEGADYPVLRWFLAPVVQNPLSDQVIPIDGPFMLSAAAVFEDLSNTGLNYTVVLSPDNALPTWLAFDEESVIFSGMPQNGDVGGYTLIITACSANLLCATDEFTVYVSMTANITNCNELQAMQNDLYGVYYLINDIDCSDTVNWNGGEGFQPVGNGTVPFGGILDGQDHVIEHLTINRNTTDYVALFGATGESSVISHVGLVSVDISGGRYTGGLVGLNYATLSYCYTTGNVTATVQHAGGLTGRTHGVITKCHSATEVSGNFDTGGLVGTISGGATIEYSYATGNILGTTGSVGGLVGSGGGIMSYCYATGNVVLTPGPGPYIGGLVGRNTGITISYSYATGNVTAPLGAYVGGLIGRHGHHVKDSYARGAVTGDIRIGGFAGWNFGGSTITNSYATGITSGVANIGGLVGYGSNGAAQSFWDTETSNQVGSIGGTGQTTAQMYQQATFVGWNFTHIWWIDEGNDYPVLQALSPPIIQNPIAEQNTFANVLFSFTVPGNTFFDFTAPALTFSAKQTNDAGLPSWLSFFPENQTFSGSPALSDRGQYSIDITACDDFMLCKTASFTLNVNNQVPVLAQPIPDQRFTAEAPFTWRIPTGTFTDADGDTFTYTAELSGGGTLPAWLDFNGTTGTLSGTIPSSQSAALQIDITAADGYGGEASDEFEMSVSLPPVLQGFVDNQAASVGNPFLFTFSPATFSEPDGEPMSYNATKTDSTPLPVWLSFDGPTRTFLGTPTLGDQGLLFVLLTASDPYGGSASASFGIAISSSGGNNPPVLVVAIPAQTGNLAELWTFVVPPSTFQDPESDSLTYSATLEGGLPLPLWLIFDPLTQTFSGATADPGAWRVTVRVEDGNGGFALSTFTLTVEDTRNRPPVLLNPLPNQEVKVDTNFGYTIPDNTFSDPNDDTLRYTAVQSGNRSLPGWLTFDETTRTFSGKPSNTDTNTFADRKHTIQVCAHDEEASACSDFLLTVSGASQTQEALTGLIIFGSIVSGLYSVYLYRAPLWNTFLKKKYMQPDKGSSFTHTFSCKPKEVCIVKAFQKNGNPLQGLKDLPESVNHSFSTMTVSGTYSDDDILICALAYDNRRLEAFWVRTGTSSEEDKGCWEKLTGLCTPRKKKDDMEMSGF